MRKHILLFFAIILLVDLNSLHAQIVNIEDRRGNLADTVGWFGHLGAGINFIKNQKSVTTINGNARVEFLKKKHRMLSLTNYNLISADQEKFIDNGFQHLRYNYDFYPRWIGELFAQAQFNSLVRIQFRGLLGTGIRYQVVRRAKEKIYLGISYMYEYDEIKMTSDQVSLFRDHRMSSYLSLSILPFSGNVRITNTTYYQPVLKKISDVRLSSQTSLAFKFSKQLTFTTIFNITNDTRVPQGIPQTYFSLKNGIRWEF